MAALFVALAACSCGSGTTQRVDADGGPRGDGGDGPNVGVDGGPGAGDDAAATFHGWRPHAATTASHPNALVGGGGDIFLLSKTVDHFRAETWTRELTADAFDYEAGVRLADGRVCVAGWNDMMCSGGGAWSRASSDRMSGSFLSQAEDGKVWGLTTVPDALWELDPSSGAATFHESVDTGGQLAIAAGHAYVADVDQPGRILAFDLARLPVPVILRNDFSVAYESKIELRVSQFARLFRTSKGEVVAVGPTLEHEGTVAVLEGGTWKTLPSNLPGPPDPRSHDPSLKAPDGMASDDLWAPTNTQMMHFDGSAWTKDPGSPAFTSVTNIFVEGPGHVWAFDSATGILWERRP